MNEDNIFEQEETSFTMDKIIEKIIPIVGAILLTVGIGYLLYTNVWLELNLPIKLGLGFLLSFTIIGGALSFSDKLKSLTDIFVGVGILLLYGTLIYGSRASDTANALIPEIATLISSFIFTFIISFLASARKSKIILILVMIGAYITPFVIGQNDVWTQNISFNAYLIYFASINIVVFQLGKEISIRNIIPLNIIGLFIGTSTLYKLSYSSGITVVGSTGFFSGYYFSAILFLVLTVFSIGSIVISSKQFEDKDEQFIAFGYLSSILWFIFNISLLSSISGFFKASLFVILSISCFYAWYFLRDIKTRYQHISLYAGGVLSLIIAFFTIIPNLNIYSSLAISYSSFIFAGLYVFGPSNSNYEINYCLI